MHPTLVRFRWVARSTVLLALELVFAVAFFNSAFYGFVAGAYVAWHLTAWPFMREWEATVATVSTVCGATIGGCAWLILRYKVIQPSLRWIGLAKRPKSINSTSLKPAI